MRLVALAAAVWLALAAAAVAAPPLKLRSERRLDDRLVQLQLRSSHVRGPTEVRVLLPEGYTRSRRRYPVLYLLHGALDDYTAWTAKGDAERLTAGLPLIVVMPDSGPGGGYTNWFNGGAGRPPAWESYHIGQLLPFVDKRYRTTGSRAVAGLSMGGGGAMSYASRHPDRFVAAASFSGAVDLTNPAIVSVTGDGPYGPFATQEIRWRAHNSVDLAENLRGLALTIRGGNGQPGGPLGGTQIDPLETVTHQAETALHERLGRLGIAHVWDDYGAGNHTWPYWRRDLRLTLPSLMRRLARGPAKPARVTFTAAESAYDVHGWRVTTRRRALEFSTLRDAGRHGFRLTGSGSATVATPALFRGCGLVGVEISDARGRRTARLRATGGRLRVTVGLGPSNRYQQFTAADRRTGHRSRTARVRITDSGCG